MLSAIAFAVTLAATVGIPPVPTQYVTDTTGVLSAPTLQHLDDELASYHDATSQRILVYIGQTTGDEPLEDWTMHAAEKWKTGSKQRDDSAILFVFMRDHKIRIEVGYGLESKLTDADSDRIIRETIAPAMRGGDVDAAITGGVNRMLLTITPSFSAANQSTPAPTDQGDPVTDAIAIGAILFIILLLIVVAVIAMRSGRRGAWYTSGGAFLGGGFGGGGFGGGGFSGGGFSGGGSFGGGGASGGW